MHLGTAGGVEGCCKHNAGMLQSHAGGMEGYCRCNAGVRGGGRGGVQKGGGGQSKGDAGVHGSNAGLMQGWVQRWCQGHGRVLQGWG